MKYSKLDLGRIEAIVNKLGGMEGVQKFLSGETVVVSNNVDPFRNVFSSIVLIQYKLELTFVSAGIDLRLVCVDNKIPSFSGASINDASGSSLDIEFKNKKGHFLIFHLFNRNSFALTFNTYGPTNIYPLKRLTDNDFLKGIKDFFNKYDYNGKEEVRKAAFNFRKNFRK